MKPEVLEEQSASFKVEEILKYVMYSPGENVMAMGKMPRDAKIVNGLTRMYGFHPTRLTEKRSEVIELIEQICSDEFIVGRGGGQSFLNLAVDREGVQWTSFHLVIEAFLVLSIGLRSEEAHV